MAPDEFEILARLLRRRSGMAVSRDRSDMMRRRLAPVMRRFGFRDMRAMVAEIRQGNDHLAEAVTEMMTVNDTCFFRDPAQFAWLQESLLPRLVAARAGQKRLHIWSAACATGQEAWSLAMLLDEMNLVRQGWRIDLIATDFSAAAIARATEGRYGAFEVQRGLGGKARHLRAQGDEWVVGDHLRPLVQFRRFNLLDSYGWLDSVDLILCRNVLMYFDAAARADVLARMADTLAPDGVLMLGESETGEMMPPGLEAVTGAGGVYRRAPSLMRRVG